MEVPKRADELFRLREYLQLEALVWETEVRPNAKNGGRFSGEAKGGFLRMWRLLCLGSPALIDVTPAQLAALVGAADAKTGRRLLVAWKAVGLVKQRGQAVKGRYTIEVLDPRDVLIVRRQPSDGQSNFLDDREEAPAAEPESCHVAGRVGTGADAPAGDSPPPVPIPPEGADGGADGRKRRGASAGASAGRTAGASAAAHAPARISRGGELPREHDYETLRTMYPHLCGDVDSETLKEDLSRDSKVAHAPGGASAGASAAAAAAEFFLTRLLAADPLERKIEQLRAWIPGLWFEPAEWAVHEAAGMHGGETCFDADELARIVARTRGLMERKQLRKPPWVHFTGACEKRFAELGRKWIRFKPAKPKPR